MKGNPGMQGSGGRLRQLLRRAARAVFGTGGAALLAASLSFGCLNPIRPDPVRAPDPAGQPDNSFGWFGAFIMDPSPGADTAAAMVYDGRFLFLGGSDEVTGPGDAEWRVEKRSATDGIKDEGFGAAGVVTSNPGPGPDTVTTLALDAGSNALFVAGTDSSPGDRQWRIERRRMCDGALDTAFGTGGVVLSNPSSGADEPTAVLFAGGDLYVVGFDESAGIGDSQWRIEKRSATTGALVATFGLGGVVTSNPSAGADVPRAVSIGGTTGTFLLAGFDSAPGDREWRLEARRLGDGALDGSFGIGGVIAANPSVGADETAAIAVDPWGLYLAGSDESPGSGDTQWRTERRNPATGTLDPWFGSGGVVTSNPSPGGDAAIGIVVWGSQVWVGGNDSGPSATTAGDRQWRAEKYVSSGALDTTFGSGGILTINPTPGEDFVGAMLVTAPYIAPPSRTRFTVAGDPLYLLGTENSPANPRWRIESRHP